MPDWRSVVLIVSSEDKSPREMAVASFAAFLNSYRHKSGSER